LQKSRNPVARRWFAVDWLMIHMVALRFSLSLVTSAATGAGLAAVTRAVRGVSLWQVLGSAMDFSNSAWNLNLRLRLWRDGQIDPKGAAAAGLAFHRDHAVMFPHDPSTTDNPKPRP